MYEQKTENQIFNKIVELKNNTVSEIEDIKKDVSLSERYRMLGKLDAYLELMKYINGIDNVK
jgi:hypothetical protein